MSESIYDSILELKFVGAKRSEAFSSIGINTIKDLFNHAYLYSSHLNNYGVVSMVAPIVFFNNNGLYTICKVGGKFMEVILRQVPFTGI